MSTYTDTSISIYNEALKAGWRQVEDIQLYDDDSRETRIQPDEYEGLFRETYVHPVHREVVSVVVNERGDVLEASAVVDGVSAFRFDPAAALESALVWLHVAPAN